MTDREFIKYMKWIQKIYEIYNYTEDPDPRYKGEHPEWEDENEKFIEQTRSLTDEELENLFRPLDPDHLEALFAAISVMIDERDFLERYIEIIDKHCEEEMEQFYKEHPEIRY